MTEKMRRCTAAGVVMICLASGSLLLSGRAAAGDIEPYRAQEIKPYTAREVLPYQAKEIQPYQSEGIEVYRGQEIQPVQTKTVEPVRAKSVEPVQAQGITPTDAATVKLDKANEVTAGSEPEIVKPLNSEKPLSKSVETPDRKGKKAKPQSKEAKGDGGAKRATSGGGNPYADPYSIMNYNTGQPQSVFTVPGLVH